MIELFDTGIEGTFSAFFIDDKLISIKVNANELMQSDSKEAMITALDEDFGEGESGSDDSSEFMFWENKITKITLYTDSSYDHMVNLLYLEKKLD